MHHGCDDVCPRCILWNQPSLQKWDISTSNKFTSLSYWCVTTTDTTLLHGAPLLLPPTPRVRDRPTHLAYCINTSNDWRWYHLPAPHSWHPAPHSIDSKCCQINVNSSSVVMLHTSFRRWTRCANTPMLQRRPTLYIQRLCFHWKDFILSQYVKWSVVISKCYQYMTSHGLKHCILYWKWTHSS